METPSFANPYSPPFDEVPPDPGTPQPQVKQLLVEEHVPQASPPFPFPCSPPATAKVEILLERVRVLHFGQVAASLSEALTNNSKLPLHFSHVYSNIGINHHPPKEANRQNS
jgi:hypothetical protein